MALRNRKIMKKRGSRSCGKGYNKRGAGGRGGSGMAGTSKSKWTWVVKYDKNRFGKHGFNVPTAVKEEVNSINIGEIEEMASKVEISDKKEQIKGLSWDNKKLIVDLIQLDYDKVLGKGKLTRPVVVKARRFSKLAEEKIKSIGGETILVEG